jgi:prepilin-type N-terminal cleavage/methylation domain-containing protein
MKRAAFTLIELLIVVAIIAILAAIAVPNFLEAQTRSKVSRVKSDLRSVATAAEAYCVDFNHYPYPLMGVIAFRDNMFPPNNASLAGYLEFIMELSTPVAYLSSVAIHDPFMPDPQSVKAYNGWDLPSFYKNSCLYFNYDGFWGTNYGAPAYAIPKFNGYCLASYGPDRGSDGIEHIACEAVAPNYKPNYGRVYDPTNGTMSHGDIARFGGNTKFNSLGGSGN